MAHPRLTSRAAGHRDLPALVALAEAPAVRPYLAWRAAARFEPALVDDRQDVLVFEVDGAFAGGARLVLRNARNRIGEVRTLMLRPGLHGRGLGVAALRSISALAFEARGMHRLEGEVLTFNRAGTRAFEAAGFTREGVRRRAWMRHGAWHDSVLLGLLAGEHTAG